MTRPSRRAARALGHLAQRDPAMAALSLWCLHRDHAEPTRTSGDTIQYGPGFEHLPLHEQLGVVAHHVLHVALRHPSRMAAMQTRLGPRFDATLYALATDALVNEVLLLADYALPRPCVRLTELLGSVGIGVFSARDAVAQWDADRLYLHLAQEGATAQKSADYGTAKEFVRDLDPTDDARTSDVESGTDWQGRVMRAMEIGRLAGSGIGALSGHLGELSVASVPWERLLRRLLVKAVSDAPRRSWKRPAGRWIAAEAQAIQMGRPVPAFEPGRQRDARRPRIVIGLDTSSSVDDLTLSLFAAEAAGIARRTGAQCHVLGFDETVHTAALMGPGAWEEALSQIEMRRGGGTSYVDLMHRIAALDPSIAVILTDLDGAFGLAPAVRILWAVPSGTCVHPPFGEILTLA